MFAVTWSSSTIIDQCLFWGWPNMNCQFSPQCSLFNNKPKKVKCYKQVLKYFTVKLTLIDAKRWNTLISITFYGESSKYFRLILSTSLSRFSLFSTNLRHKVNTFFIKITVKMRKTMAWVDWKLWIFRKSIYAEYFYKFWQIQKKVESFRMRRTANAHHIFHLQIIHGDAYGSAYSNIFNVMSISGTDSVQGKTAAHVDAMRGNVIL